MQKQQSYVAAIELAIQALDSAFLRANAAETLAPLMPVSALWALPPDERAEAERMAAVSYDVTPDHWGARLNLMAAFESLHAALRIVSSTRAATHPEASAWRDAASHSAEASRLAECARRVLAHETRD